VTGGSKRHRIEELRLRRKEFEKRFPGLLATLTTVTAIHQT
jgi:hypothetical protein